MTEVDIPKSDLHDTSFDMFVCLEVLWPSQPNGVMMSTVILPNHTFNSPLVG